MKWILLGIIFLLPLSLLCQVNIGKPWNVECGASSNTAFNQPGSFNLRYVSPRFKWSEDWTEEEDKHPEKYKNTRLMMELIYKPLFEVLSMGLNVQQRFVRAKRFSMELYGGLKFFFIPGPDFVTIPYLKGGKNAWYLNVGLLCQLNLGMIAPFADIGGDGIITIGTELNLHYVYKKPQKRYKLQKRKRFLWQRSAQ
jgi:hypothetical protein